MAAQRGISLKGHTSSSKGTWLRRNGVPSGVSGLPILSIRKWRIERARIYLADGKETLSEIAYATGFSSQAHFSSVFRRMIGITPTDYRRSLQ
jgi:hypothetical protein